nr:MAG TPA: hypothetical protein [Caudoviricetes sp.]
MSTQKSAIYCRATLFRAFCTNKNTHFCAKHRNTKKCEKMR